jgi:hypothetical protein
MIISSDRSMPVTCIAFSAIANDRAPVPHATSITRYEGSTCSATLLRSPDIKGSINIRYMKPFRENLISYVLRPVKITGKLSGILNG